MFAREVIVWGVLEQRRDDDEGVGRARRTGVFRHLIQVDPDAFWLTLSQLHAPFPYAPPHPHLQPLQLGGAGPTRDQYTHNLDRLLRDAFGAPGSQTPGSLG
ncbi:unnamed protein product [Lota lota]